MTCEVCEKEFRYQDCPNSQKVRRRFCSRECIGIGRRGPNYGKLSTCETCGSLFIPCRQGPQYHARYCSQQCAGIAKRSSGHGRTKICEHCGKEFADNSSPNRPRRFCSQDCFKRFTREQPGYKGGASAKVSFKEKVVALFPSPCAICGWDIARTDAAHIVPHGEGGPDTVENGVILCPNHHRMFDSGLIPLGDIIAARDASLGLS